MTTRLIKWGAIALLVVAVAWVAYQWGKSVAREQAAEARTAAVQEARAEARREYQQQLEAARERARAHAERVEQLRERVEDQQRAVEDYAQSDQGQRECFGDEGVEQFNAL